MTRRSFAILPVGAAAAPLLPTKAELDRLIVKLEKTLTENILGFWYPNTIDPAGGYLLNHDVDGNPKGPGVRMIVTQARMVWFYSRMARWGHEPKNMLAAAEHGYRFLRSKMWDSKDGGFFWELDAGGNATKRNKHLYGQSFAIYAIAEYAMASRRKDVLEFAMRFFDLLEKRAHDPVHGGYVEYFLPDWSTPPVNEPIYIGDSAPGMKLMNTHLHLMEAMTTLYQASHHATVRDRLLELISIESNAVVRKAAVVCTDKYNRDWSPRLEGSFATVSYGHDLENIWLIVEAARAAGVPFSPYVDLFRANFAKCRSYGFDEKLGGFFTSGAIGEAANNRNKSWWVQAEALVGALTMYQLTSNTEYFDVFRKTWDFCDKFQIDWKHGDWHSNLSPAGKAEGDKAQAWKSAYHNGRAMMESILRLRAIREKTA
ncbi:AGE family epimerase/isomerase [Bryobacter aggregatus]|uniref:AGE family epimerase/isomerase n=1 Tax=Bryobacter aggregatus TaxID=360054 RepID=UPI00138E3297|nr:AGE family epimerase/isomerase [Bryobacter aggregatus]